MQIESYLFFNGNCEEALAFYTRALDGKVTTLMRYGGSPMEGQELPPDWSEKVMHAHFEAEGAGFMASDGMPGAAPAAYGGFALSIYIREDVERARRVFNALADGGQVTLPFAPPFWGGHFGMLNDRFGVPWMVSCE
jgi:PhnB protein